MDIVDAQVHADMLGTEVTLAIMDALGVQGVLFDEYQRTDGDGAAQPGYRLADGTFRPIGPNAESAALRHPERFAFLMRVDPRDPGIEGWIETLATAPGFKALRTIVLTQADAAVFGDGGSDRLLKAARAHSLPLFVTCPGRMLLLEVCAKRFPDVQFVIDHCGAAFDAPRGKATIDDAITMARYPNVAYKWARIQPDRIQTRCRDDGAWAQASRQANRSRLRDWSALGGRSYRHSKSGVSCCVTP